MSYRDDPATARESDPAASQAGETVTPRTQDPSRNMLPGREQFAGWTIGLVVAGVSVILSAVLWSSR
jgi:hypothetical protein